MRISPNGGVDEQKKVCRIAAGKKERKNMQGYYAPAFEDMQTTTIQMTLRQAQIELDHAEGATREVLCEVIRGAARELLFRYREGMKNLP